MITILRTAIYEQRCAAVMLASSRAVGTDVGTIIAKHAADGTLRSGATIKRSISAFENQTRLAVEQLQAEFAARIQGRGGNWKRAMAAIHKAIDGQLQSATHLLERPFTIAAGSAGEPTAANASVAAAIEDELRAVGERLHDQHSAFSEGWTAPLGKPWHERHPVLYALFAAIGGAVLTGIGGLIVD